MKLASLSRNQTRLRLLALAYNFAPLRRGHYPIPQAHRAGDALVFHQKPTPVLMELPRSGQGRPPRRPVYIPQPPLARTKAEMFDLPTHVVEAIGALVALKGWTTRQDRLSASKDNPPPVDTPPAA